MNKPRGRPFEVGNTAGHGRPKGSRNKATLAKSELFDEYSESVTRKCLSMALKGDPVAMRLCMERIHPTRRAMSVKFKVPRVRSLNDLPAALNSIMRAVASGKLTPAEGQQIVPLLESIGEVLSAQELQSRLQILEKEMDPQPTDESEPSVLGESMTQ
jgi:hypothetical protein